MESLRIEEVKIALDGDFGVNALVFLPEGSNRKAAVIAIPDADQSAEDFAGIAEGMTTAGWLRELLGRGDRRSDSRDGGAPRGPSFMRQGWRT